jgi:hypothetical protein
MVDDLEAVRKQIGADKMILIGHSWRRWNFSPFFPVGVLLPQ